ncbi:hypothetical protein [Arthrobacter sp. NyZ413]|uniref:hypothetical protein n=1 Tax=Arthrobacter sp. NyZ413 TaxID=3144669 RepID=UPI002C4EA4E7|nr:hypothetical protein [Arthrobacter sp.]
MAKTRAQRIKKHGANAVVPEHSSPSVVNPTTQRSPEKAASNAKLVVVAGIVASVLLFWYVHLLTLNQMTQLSGGLAMPDSLIGGFSTDYVQHLHSAMNDDARGQLSFIHKTAGTLFPLIFAFTWILLIGTNVAGRAVRWALWAAPLLFAVVRLWGNIAIDTTLASPVPDGGQVALASTLTVVGWVLFLASVVVGVVAAVLGRQRSKRA